MTKIIYAETFTDAVKKEELPVPLVDGEIHPFFASITNIANGTTSTAEIVLGNKNNLLSLTIEIDDDNKGVVLVNAYVNDGRFNRQIGKPTGIYDGTGYNEKRFSWHGQIPLSLDLVNYLYINIVNYSGQTINKINVIGDTN